MRKSWKPSECDQTSSLHRLVGDFVSEDHLFIDLMINHRVRSLDPRSLLAVAVAHGEAGVQFLDGRGRREAALISTSEGKRIISQSSL
jgi:hypothetical protein